MRGLPPQEEYPELPTKSNNSNLESKKKTKTNYHRCLINRFFYKKGLLNVLYFVLYL